MRLFITGTDTGVGKTRVTAAFARALATERNVTIVKLAQTGVDAGEPGDAETAGVLAGCAWRELHRFRLPADPWTAALAEGRTPLRALALASELDALGDDLVIEGSGGIAVPLNDRETLADVALHARAQAVVVVGLRLGCINHATLTLEYLAKRGIALSHVVYTEPWEPVDARYRVQVERALAPRIDACSGASRADSAPTDERVRTCHVPFEVDPTRSVVMAARASAEPLTDADDRASSARDT